MKVLGIESTCDETAVSIVEDGEKILSQVISSQIDLHNIYGGVVPELACRRHMEVIIPVIDQALKDAHLSLSEIDLIAVAYGPGLVGPLFVGLQTAKGLALSLNKPLVGVNHVEAHLYAAIMSSKLPIKFPCIGVVLSGGHTNIIKIHELGSYELIGQTVDDAIGEAFDKVAKLLGLPYPGGPYIEKLAEEGDSERFALKAGVIKENPYSFSFSGLKTAVLYAYKAEGDPSPKFKKDLCASFQKVAFQDVFQKVRKACLLTNSDTVLFGGGVTNNQALHKIFADQAPELYTHWPAKNLSLDNASMIAGLGYHVFLKKGAADITTLSPVTRIPFA